MKKKYLIILSFFLLLVFTYCSAEKDSFSEKPPIDTSKPPIDTTKPQAEEGFTLLPKDHVPNSDLYGEGEILQNQSTNPKYMLSTRKFQGIPSIGKDRLGNLYVGWIASSGCAGECDDNYLTISVSSDNGTTWNHDKLILSVNPEDSTRMKETNFFNDKEGNLYMYWGKHVKKKGVKEWIITWYSKIDLSVDGSTINYTPPRRIVEGIMLNKLIYSSNSDEVLFPVARWYEGDPVLHQPFIYKANFGTKNLVNFQKVGAIPVPASISGIHEHMIVQLKDNTYLGMVRTKDGIYFSKSSDGNTWLDAKKYNTVGATPYSRFYLGKLNSGRIILIFNNAGDRSKLTLCLFEDDGTTFLNKIVIDNYKILKHTVDGDYHGVSYPDMIETSPGVLNIVYDRLRAPEGSIILVKILEEDILKNNTSNIFTTKISTLK